MLPKHDEVLNLHTILLRLQIIFLYQHKNVDLVEG